MLEEGLQQRDERFRQDVRRFVETMRDRLPPPGEDATYTREHARAWTCALDGKGWLVPHWTRQWGGMPLPPVRRLLLYQELIAADMPPLDVIGIFLAGPAICSFGTLEQQQRYLPRIRKAQDLWCQGFSEPNAGSDLTTIATTGVRQGNRFIVNGTKLWTTNAHNADMMFALVRIDLGAGASPGLSFMLIDMHSPGVTVRAVPLIDRMPRVNEVHLRDVSVPLENLIGEPGKGWLYARALLANERSAAASSAIVRRQLQMLGQSLQADTGQPVCDRRGDRLRYAQLRVELSALEAAELRLLRASAGDSALNILPSILKVRGAQLRQLISEALLEVHGESALRSMEPLDIDGGTQSWHASMSGAQQIAMQFLFDRSATIAAGATEIQHNIIAATALESWTPP